MSSTFESRLGIGEYAVQSDEVLKCYLSHKTQEVYVEKDARNYERMKDELLDFSLRLPTATGDERVRLNSFIYHNNAALHELMQKDYHRRINCLKKSCKVDGMMRELEISMLQCNIEGVILFHRGEISDLMARPLTDESRGSIQFHGMMLERARSHL